MGADRAFILYSSQRLYSYCPYFKLSSGNHELKLIKDFGLSDIVSYMGAQALKENKEETRETSLSAFIEYGEHSLAIPIRLSSKDTQTYLGFSYTDEGSTILAFEKGELFLGVEALVNGPVRRSRFLKRQLSSPSMSIASQPFYLNQKRQSPSGDMLFWLDNQGRLCLRPPFTVTLSGKYLLGGAFSQSFNPIYVLERSMALAKIGDIDGDF